MSIKASDVGEWLLGSGPHLVVMNILSTADERSEREICSLDATWRPSWLVAVTTE
jgi:hypothetical protein